MNFFPATVAWLVIAVVDYLALFNYLNIGLFGDGAIRYIVYFVDFLIAVVSVMFTVYVFPVLSRFTLTKKQLFASSLILSIKHFLPWTFLMTAMFVGILYLAEWSFYVFPVFTLLLPSIGCLLISLPMEKVLKMNTPASDDSSVDEWYME